MSKFQYWQANHPLHDIHPHFWGVQLIWVKSSCSGLGTKLGPNNAVSTGILWSTATELGTKSACAVVQFVDDCNRVLWQMFANIFVQTLDNSFRYPVGNFGHRSHNPRSFFKLSKQGLWKGVAEEPGCIRGTGWPMRPSQFCWVTPENRVQKYTRGVQNRGWPLPHLRHARWPPPPPRFAWVTPSRSAPSARLGDPSDF